MQIRGKRLALGRSVQALRRIAPVPNSFPRPRIRIMILGAHVVCGREDIHGQSHRATGSRS
eukprot:11956011-Prorocentrum_lima.AAC.1